MKTTFFQVGIKAIFPQLFQDLANSVDVILAQILGIDKDVFKVDEDGNVKFLNKNLINEIFKASQSV